MDSETEFHKERAVLAVSSSARDGCPGRNESQETMKAVITAEPTPLPKSPTLCTIQF
jgi:hypothetical protein